MHWNKNLRLDKQHEGGKETQAGSDFKPWTLLPSAEHLWLNWDQSSGFQSLPCRGLWRRKRLGFEATGWAHEILFHVEPDGSSSSLGSRPKDPAVSWNSDER